MVPPERPGVAVDRGAAVEDGVTVRDGGGTAVGVADGRAGSRAVVRVLGGLVSGRIPVARVRARFGRAPLAA